MKKSLIACLLATMATGLGASSIDTKAAAKVFEEARTACTRDNGSLWGASLCGPLMVVDPHTRWVVASEKDGKGVLREDDGVYVGTLPKDVGIANSALDWSGRKWTMVLWPLPDERVPRVDLLMHESWHRIQDDLGLPQSAPTNAHLDMYEGRIWMRREWRALKTALQSEGKDRRAAVMHAILFREHRREILPGSATSERLLEMNEGLAAYTGLKLATPDDDTAVARAIELIDQHDSLDGFVRTFAYASGPAYGLLLDLAGADWRRNLDAGDDFTRLLLRAYELEMPASVAAWARRMQRDYPDDTLLPEESERDKRVRKEQLAIRASFLENRVLILPLESMEMDFDPTAVRPLPPFGTVYETITLRGSWGRLVVKKGGVLIDDSFSNARLPLPGDADHDLRETDSWTLELQEGWSVTDSKARPPHFVLSKDTGGD